MENGVTTANRGVLETKRPPGKADAWFQSGLVQLDTDAPVGVYPRNQIIASRRGAAGAVKVKVGLAVLGFCDWRDDGLSQAQDSGSELFDTRKSSWT